MDNPFLFVCFSKILILEDIFSRLFSFENHYFKVVLQGGIFKEIFTKQMILPVSKEDGFLIIALLDYLPLTHYMNEGKSRNFLGKSFHFPLKQALTVFFLFKKNICDLNIWLARKGDRDSWFAPTLGIWVPLPGLITEAWSVLMLEAVELVFYSIWPHTRQYGACSKC